MQAHRMRSSPSRNLIILWCGCVVRLGLRSAYRHPVQPSVSPPATSAAGTAARGALRSDTTAAPPAAVGVETVASPLPTEATLAELPRDLTPLAMFVSADIILKAVILGLAFASALTWTVWLSRMMRATGRAVCRPVRHVWGTMNSFIGISRLHTTNLADVAPGIAQAPLAKALGRAPAVPAVAICHDFARAIARCRALYANASVEIVNHTSHDLSYAQIVDDGRVRAAVQAGAR